jgi:uncharacterized protein with GYD domain
MALYVMLSRLPLGLPHNGQGVLDVHEHEVAARLRRECPEVFWVASYAVRGPYDYVDVFSAPHDDVALEVRTIMRSLGQAEAEVWAAIESPRFRALAADR